MQKYGGVRRLEKNNDIPTSIPKKIALLYQTKLDIEFEKTQKEGGGGAKDDEDSIYLTCLFLNKHLNGKKLSSHMWFFEGFCRFLQPKYCCFIDVGTIPEKDGIVNYYLSLESQPDVGGLAGYMGLYYDD